MAEIVSFKKEGEEAGGILLASLEQGVLRLTLNNPPANALSIALMSALQQALDAAEEDKAVRVVIIAGNAKLFSAGHDLKEMTARRSDADGGRGFFEQTIRMCAKLMLTITQLSKPVIAEVEGLATAAGAMRRRACWPATNVGGGFCFRTAL